MKVLCLIFSFLSLSANSSDFESEMNRLKTSSSIIDQNLRNLGVVGGSSSILTNSILNSSSANNLHRKLIEIHASSSPAIFKAGTVVKCRLLNRLIVGGVPSPVILRITDFTSPFYNAKLLGEATQGSPEDRLFLKVTTLIPSFGNQIFVTASALDEFGSLGLRAEVLSSRALRFAGALGSSFVSGMATGYQNDQTSALGLTSRLPTTRNAILQGLAQTSADQSKLLIDQATREVPVLVLNEGAKISLLFGEVSR